MNGFSIWSRSDWSSSSNFFFASVDEVVLLEIAGAGRRVLRELVERVLVLRDGALELVERLARDLALLRPLLRLVTRRSMPSRSVFTMSSSFFLMSSRLEPRS